MKIVTAPPAHLILHNKPLKNTTTTVILISTTCTLIESDDNKQPLTTVIIIKSPYVMSSVLTVGNGIQFLSCYLTDIYSFIFIFMTKDIF